MIEAIIEIPKGSRNKYEIDKKSGRMRLDRVLKSSVAYPADYGYMPDTLCDDGDPLDFMVITRFPTFPGCLVPTRPIALFKMIDSGVSDEKIISVPEGDSYFDSWSDLVDIPNSLRSEIEEFFRTYKNLQSGKFVEVLGWGDASEAMDAINKAEHGFLRTKNQN